MASINSTHSQIANQLADETYVTQLTDEDFLSKLVEAIKIRDNTSIELLHRLGLQRLNQWAVLFCAYFASHYQRPDLAQFYQNHFTNTWSTSLKLKANYNRAQKTCGCLARLHAESKEKLI